MFRHTCFNTCFNPDPLNSCQLPSYPKSPNPPGQAFQCSLRGHRRFRQVVLQFLQGCLHRGPQLLAVAAAVPGGRDVDVQGLQGGRQQLQRGRGQLGTAHHALRARQEGLKGTRVT